MKNIVLLIVLLILMNMKFARAEVLASTGPADASLSNQGRVLLDCVAPNFKIVISETAEALLVVDLWSKDAGAERFETQLLQNLAVEILVKEASGRRLPKNYFIRLGGERFKLSLSRQHNYGFMGLMNYQGPHILLFKSCSVNRIFETI